MRPAHEHYDVVIAGARCAGASTAMLLARSGLRVLAVDPVRYGSDTLSTHALMRGAVLQLHRWGLLDAVRASGATPIRTTTFHYDQETVEIEIKPRDGVDALYAPRRTVLDPILVDAAVAAGAEIIHGMAVVDVIRDRDGRARGVRVAGPDRTPIDVSADLVIGADGMRSRIARIVGAEFDRTERHAACSIYGYFENIPLTGNHWFFKSGTSVGTIPTNDDRTCVFALLPQARFQAELDDGIETMFDTLLIDLSDTLHDAVRSANGATRLRAFAGMPGYLRRAAGPGWVLVGDAGYFKDPITAHGITDALREAEFVSRAVMDGESALASYQEQRDERVIGLLSVTDRIASCEWDLEEVKQLHLDLNREMKAEVESLLSLASQGGPPDAHVADSAGIQV